jgi:uncharacterized protein involved in copper resistance
MNSRVEVMATLDGATHVLNALIRGEVTKEWLKSPGDVEEEVSALLMRRSIAMRPYRDAQVTSRRDAKAITPSWMNSAELLAEGTKSSIIYELNGANLSKK